MSISEKLKSYLELAFDNAEKGISKISEEIETMNGMSGKKTRHFYNNLASNQDIRYLEIGTWTGSTVCAAMCGNKAQIVCIDNWSEFGGPKDLFLSNFSKYKGENLAQFIEGDCFQINISELPKFNVYMYDANHTKESHYKSLVYYYNCLDDIFIHIIDDWNCEEVRLGSKEAMRTLGFSILYEKEIKTTNDNSHPPWGSPEQQGWHNGIYVCILQKSK